MATGLSQIQAALPAMTQPILELSGIEKCFGGVSALRQASLEVMPGEIHGLVGENGAGKSTLINIATGVLPPDAGRLALAGLAFLLGVEGFVRLHDLASAAHRGQAAGAHRLANAVRHEPGRLEGDAQHPVELV